MKKLFSLLLFCCILVISAYLLFGGMEEWMESSLGAEKSLGTYAAFSFFFLSSDILLPVPNSLVMLLNGKMLGVFWGTLLSSSSGLLSSMIGFYLGRSATTYLSRLFSNREQEASNMLFHKFGNAAIAISKALPILSEAVSFVSGTTSTSFKDFLVYSFVGHLMVSLVYAYAGSKFNHMDSGLMAFIVIVSAFLLSWVTQSALKKNRLLKT